MREGGKEEEERVARFMGGNAIFKTYLKLIVLKKLIVYLKLKPDGASHILFGHPTNQGEGKGSGKKGRNGGGGMGSFSWKTVVALAMPD